MDIDDEAGSPREYLFPVARAASARLKGFDGKDTQCVSEIQFSR